ncbi:MAG: hypothetical protein LLG04_08525 [Parachlamydia sp.]|nr:hypothetical protein [Parachlamydia sp.]
MHLKSAMMTRVLINRFHKGNPDALLRFLPESEADEVNRLPINSPEFSPLFSPLAEQISRVHHTWILPVLQKVPPVAQGQLLGVLPDKMATPLSDQLSTSSQRQTLAPCSQQFLQHLILKNLTGFDEVTPLSYLPETPLSQLGTWSKRDLVQLISFLGIHDLAEEIRHIVDKKRIKGIYLCLTAKEQQYLRYCMHLKEKFVAPPLGLDKWSGDCDKLKITLQARGLIRLGKALSGEHPDLIWHLSHIFDMGRGKTLSKYYAKEPVTGLTSALSQQVVNLMGILKKKGGS